MSILNLKSSYKFYKAETKNPVSVLVFLSILYNFMNYIMQRVLKGDVIVLPSMLGSVYVKGTTLKPKIVNGKINGLNPDWKATKELWVRNEKAKEEKKLIYHLNEHSNGVRYKYVWSQKRMLVRYKSLYYLEFTRKNKRTLASMIKQGKEYITKDK